MNYLALFALAVAGFGITYLLVPMVIALAKDLPSAGGRQEVHHTHKTPVPRLGGVALVVTFVALVFLVAAFGRVSTYSPAIQLAVVLGAVAMFFVGVADDLRPIGARKKLVLQIGIAALVYFLGVRIEVLQTPLGGEVIEMGLWSGLVTILWLVLFTNLINLVDGADGLAGGICLMLMGLLAYTGGGRDLVTFLAAGMAGALIAFLRFNFPPARIYLGDGGAYFLGFLIGMLAILSSNKGTVAAALIAPLFVLALPMVDTVLVLTRRALKGLPLFRPDRKHLHHRLAELGYSRRKMVLAIYGITLLFLGMGVMVFGSQGRWLPIMFGLLTLVLLACAHSFSFSREWFSVGRVLSNSMEIRADVQHAIAIKTWFELQGDRAESLDVLWQDFTFVARKLGFGYMKTVLDDAEWEWTAPGFEDGGLEGAAMRYALAEGPVRLEIKGNPESGHANGGHRARARKRNGTSRAGGEDAFSEAHRELFNITADLAAEAWHKAVLRYRACRKLTERSETKAAPEAAPEPARSGRLDVLPAIKSHGDRTGAGTAQPKTAVKADG